MTGQHRSPGGARRRGGPRRRDLRPHRRVPNVGFVAVCPWPSARRRGGRRRRLRARRAHLAGADAPARPLRRPPVLRHERVTFVVYAALGGALFLLPVELQVVNRVTRRSGSGVALLPLTFVMLALSARSGRLASADRAPPADGRRPGRRRRRPRPAVPATDGLQYLPRPCCRPCWCSLSGWRSRWHRSRPPRSESVPTEHAGIASAVNNYVARRREPAGRRRAAGAGGDLRLELPAPACAGGRLPQGGDHLRRDVCARRRDRRGRDPQPHPTSGRRATPASALRTVSHCGLDAPPLGAKT